MAGSSKIKALTSSDANTLAGQPHSYYLDANNFTNMPSSDLSGDTTPQLGGNLDLNSNNVTGTGNINVTGTITGTSFSGPLTGNADTATTLATARNIAGVSFDGSSDISLASSNLSDGSSLATLTDTQTLTNKTINLSNNTLSGTTAQFNTALSDGSFRIGYQSGEIIERISSIADGSTLSTSQGNVTFQNVTSVQLLNATYVDVTGSTISYTPPTEATRVIYEFAYQIGAQDGTDSILHAKFYIDGDEVTSARHNSGAYRAMFTNFVWVIDCAASSADTSIGALTSWTSAKTLKLTSRAYNTSYDQYYHNTRYWDGGGTTTQVTRPVLTITAIA